MQVEGYEAFKIAKPRETASSSTWIIDIPDWAENTKITVFAGFSAEAVGRHYRTPEGVRIPHRLLTFVRPTLPRPLSIAMYNSSSLTLQQPEVRQPFIIAMGGFLNDRSQRRTALIARVAPKPG